MNHSKKIRKMANKRALLQLENAVLSKERRQMVRQMKMHQYQIDQLNAQVKEIDRKQRYNTQQYLDKGIAIEELTGVTAVRFAA